MNKKYVAPIIEIESIEVTDIILTSGNGYEVTALEGVDTGDDKSAVFNVSRWIHL
ncbi:MAG: hypothetical protein J6B45_03575 [Clostridia bacterium]|nr:hypothetical protein [Clostridia bacterium]